MSVGDKIDDAFEWFVDNVAKYVIYAVIVLFVLALASLPVLFLLKKDEPAVWTLRQDEWTCTSGHTRKQEVCGKGCRWETYNVCDSFVRKGYDEQ